MRSTSRLRSILESSGYRLRMVAVGHGHDPPTAPRARLRHPHGVRTLTAQLTMGHDGLFHDRDGAELTPEEASSLGAIPLEAREHRADYRQSRQ